MNEAGYSLKEETLDEFGKIAGTQRFSFSDTGELLYAFEYNSGGKLFNCYSFKNGQGVRFEDINDIPDKEQFLTP